MHESPSNDNDQDEDLHDTDDEDNSLRSTKLETTTLTMEDTLPATSREDE